MAYMKFLFVVYRDIREVNEKYFHWGECDDMNDDCQQWAKQGLCQKDPEKMNEMCPWSCHKCAPMKLGKYTPNANMASNLNCHCSGLTSLSHM